MSVLDKTTQTLDLLGAAGEPLRLAAIATELGLPKSSAHRLLAEMAALGIVRRLGNGRYGLGPRLLYWGAVAAESFDLRAVADEPMRKLRALSGESVHLYVPQGSSMVCIAAVEGDHSLRPFVALGRPRALGSGSSGKVLLAFADDAARQEAARAARAQGRVLPTDDQLARIRAERWVTSIAEIDGDLAAAAVAVSDARDVVVGALTVSGSAARLTPERLEALREHMTGCAAEIGGVAPVRSRLG